MIFGQSSIFATVLVIFGALMASPAEAQIRQTVILGHGLVVVTEGGTHGNPSEMQDEGKGKGMHQDQGQVLQGGGEPGLVTRVYGHRFYEIRETAVPPAMGSDVPRRLEVLEGQIKEVERELKSLKQGR